MRIELDQPRCEGHGLCEEVAPDLVHLDDEGELIIDVAEIEVGTDAEQHAHEAVRICPVTALSLR
ncbi:ferredoxin [Brevibacterium sp. RIT 803]|uniref:ferredoxin n=1 Tax=Brevibacterium sp. RIT 803 TaxID=2810210 RepID=UPI00194E6306|nr:ferredoxin [Brevibacterium sp. RIT 803]MBM6591604.1 ferredoxin [Brevibacterium sp. RIT 803]